MSPLLDRLGKSAPALRRAGVTLMSVGGALVVIGVADFMANFSHSIQSRWFILAFVGMPLAAAGMACSLVSQWLGSRATAAARPPERGTDAPGS